ncbi:MAG: hypothetical protein ACFFBP_05575 [Promethearchaeota archaeon]
MEKLKNNIDKLHRIYLIVCLIAFISACISQLFLPEIIANNSAWVFADGWQREIGIWNLGIIILIIYALWAKNERFNMIITISIIVITSLFATNHLYGVITYQPVQIVNILFTILNYIAAILGVGIIIIKKIK